MFTIEGPPEWMRVLGRAAFTEDTTVQVAHLELDTLLPSHATAKARRLRFATSKHSILVSVLSKRRSVSLEIAVQPAAAVGVDVRPLHGVVRRVWTSHDGTVHCESVPPGPISFVVHWPAAAGGPVRTSWTQV